MEDEPRRNALLVAVNQLLESERAVMLLYYYEGLELREIANRFRISEDRIAQIHTKAIFKVRDLLPPDELPPEAGDTP